MMPSTDSVDALFATWDKPDSPGCVLAVIHDGELVYSRGYGMADLERGVPLSPDSAIDIGSIGKQFTAMLIAILARQGLLSLDDSLRQHVPEMPAYAQPITLRHLVHHTSGLRDYTALMELSGMPFENFYYEDEFLDLICRQVGLNFEPGEEFLYSNTGYFLLGVIARRITGQPFPQLLREHLLEPLGMQATTFNDDARRIVKDRAIGYSPHEEGGFCTEMSFCGGFGDGALVTTVGDLFLWDQNFYHNELGGGGQALIQEMLTPGRLNSGEELDYALGLFVGQHRGLRTVSHSGGWAGYRSELLRFPDQKLSVVCLANLTSINPTRLAEQVAGLYLAGQFPEPGPPSGQEATASPELPAGQLERIAGFYRNQSAGSILELSTEEGKLAGELLGLSFQLVATGPARFQAVEIPYDIQIDVQEPGPDGVPQLAVTVEGGKPVGYLKLATSPTSPTQFPAYAGEYRSGEVTIPYRVLLDGGQLFLKRGYAGPEPLRPVAQDLFTCGGLDLHFERDEQGQPSAFRLGIDRVRNLRFEVG